MPLGVLERLPANGTRISLHTELVVREDGWSLYGFDRVVEREVFQRLLGASGFGPRLALALISALGGDRTVRSIKGKDLAALSSVPGIGKKKAERLVLELQDKLDDIVVSPIAGGVARAGGGSGARAGRAGICAGAGGQGGAVGAGERARRCGIADPGRAQGAGGAMIRRARNWARGVDGEPVSQRTGVMPVAAVTAEWLCTRCGSTNRKLVAADTTRVDGPLRDVRGEARGPAGRDGR